MFQLTGLNPVTQRFVNNLMMDLPPQTPAERVDFGLDHLCPDENLLLGVYQYGLKREKFTPAELDAACTDGKKLTALVQRVAPNLVVSTAYDDPENEGAEG